MQRPWIRILMKSRNFFGSICNFLNCNNYCDDHIFVFLKKYVNDKIHKNGKVIWRSVSWFHFTSLHPASLINQFCPQLSSIQPEWFTIDGIKIGYGMMELNTFLCLGQYWPVLGQYWVSIGPVRSDPRLFYA